MCILLHHLTLTLTFSVMDGDLGDTDDDSDSDDLDSLMATSRALRTSRLSSSGSHMTSPRQSVSAASSMVDETGIIIGRYFYLFFFFLFYVNISFYFVQFTIFFIGWDF